VGPTGSRALTVRWARRAAGHSPSRPGDGDATEGMAGMTETSPDPAEAGSAVTPQPPPKSAVWPEKRFTANRAQRAGNAVVAVLTRWGLVPHTYMMTTIGRKSGQPRKTPVTLVEEDHEKWLVAPYGPVSWVLNARAAGRVTLRRGQKTGAYAIREIPATEAGPVLKKYVAIAGATRSYFKATKDSPVAEFVAEAGVHPVFELTLTGDNPDAGK
jgi:deazaflavin-dependent oxidoreductase (nitroreductase family)